MPVGRGLTHAERVADRQHHIAHAHRRFGIEGDRRQVPQADLQHRQVAFGVRADQFRGGPAPVAQAYLDRVGGLDHVVVGEDRAVGAHDHARAQAGGGLAPREARQAAQELFQPGVVGQRHQRHVHVLGGVDVDYRGRGPRHGGGVAGRCGSRHGCGRGCAGRGSRPRRPAR